MTKQTRSARYQFIFNEKSMDPSAMDGWMNDDSIYKRLNPYEYNEQVLDLQEQLHDRFMELIEEHLTSRQLEIVKMLMSGTFTQQTCAQALGINQSSITKSINGNVDYSDKDRIKKYGGIKAKLSRIANEDPRIKEILEKISDLRGESWL